MVAYHNAIRCLLITMIILALAIIAATQSSLLSSLSILSSIQVVSWNIPFGATISILPYSTNRSTPCSSLRHDNDCTPNNYGNDKVSTKRHLREMVEVARIPQFVGEWEQTVSCPQSLGEAQGGIIGNRDLIITGGFLNFTTVSRATYLLHVRTHDMKNITWRQVDDYPLSLGVTHAAEAMYNAKMFICGGFNGYPGPAQADCFVYYNVRSSNRQYHRLPYLPEPRAGGGLVYDRLHDALIFVGGTRRNVSKSTVIMDTPDTFILRLNDTQRGWMRNAKPKPYSGNHISFVSVYDKCSTISNGGIQRHYFFGGQVGQNESNANINLVYEYEVANDKWIRRTSMPFGRGHTGTSTVAYGCGFIVAGGAINNVNSKKRIMTDDISYYSSYNDTWISIGKLPRPTKTPVCSIVRVRSIPPYDKDYMFCTTGYSSKTYRREITFT